MSQRGYDIVIILRVTWCVVVILALLSAIYVSHLLQLKFATTLIATVVETTFFPVFEIPYPAITLCNYNRINWKRVPSAIDFYLGSAANETISKFHEFLIGLNAFEFGSFDEFENVKDANMSDLNHINLTELYKRVTFQCEELFIEQCWWRNKYYNCCSGNQKLFVKQKSEYGICYAFNSVLNEIGRERNKNESNYPWRTSTFGDWSGLRVQLQLKDDLRIPNLTTSSGILIMVNHPFSWPNSAYFIPKGTSTAVIIKPSYSYTTSAVRSLLPSVRQCLYPDEMEEYTYQTLPETLYFRANCLSECRQRQMIKNCNCTVDFLYPSADYAKCNFSSLRCLYDYNCKFSFNIENSEMEKLTIPLTLVLALFNYERPPAGNQYFSDEEEGIICDCLPECESIDYGFNVSPIKRVTNDIDDAITVDIHFQQSTMVKYRTDVDFDWLDLMVAFGGIAGLFLGCSLISVAEFVFYLVIGVMKLPWRKLANQRGASLNQ
ncbi:Pickpocket protein 19 [Pseudolycoriella hygida]|uniref:Pickpocket protein 19 n=1 Tax=Pseudolycoriella hygida TaxID=35572 RepID=A0A9Q0RXL1_9DIPT|nr:Pickpocket protein 19 [Pseudolycoriella hygida]